MTQRRSGAVNPGKQAGNGKVYVSLICGVMSFSFPGSPRERWSQCAMESRRDGERGTESQDNW